MPHQPPYSQESKSIPMLHSGVGWGALGINITIKELKDSRMVIPTIFQFNLPVSPLQKLDGFWKLTINYFTLH